MKNPWEDIRLNEYEKHMSLDTVYQLQAMNQIMRAQFAAFAAQSVMILGVAGGNGLEHLESISIEKIYGVDINSDYLEACVCRYPVLEGKLEVLCLDLRHDYVSLPPVDLIIANLLVEYIGCEIFSRVVQHVGARFVSCVIQIDAADSFVSESPYMAIFNDLDKICCDVDQIELIETMTSTGYVQVLEEKYALPNGKILKRIDFIKR